MKHVITALAGLAAMALSAEAQSYRCENGELVGGTSGVSAKCTVNSAGQITSVTPYQPAGRESLRIYPNDNVRAAPVKTYSPGKRTYAPTPLTPQTNVPPSAIARPNYRHNVRTITPNGDAYTGQTETYRTTQPRVINAATPSARIQAAAYGAPCNFKIREVKTRSNINVYEVCYSDIQPSNERSMRKLYSRIRKASRRACGTDYDSILTRWSRSNQACVSNSVDRAVMSSEFAPLRAYHLAKTGRGVPTVYVGEPRDAF